MSFSNGCQNTLKLGLCVLAAGTLAYAGRESVTMLSDKVGLSSRIDRIVQNGIKANTIGAFSLTATIVISPFKWGWSCIRHPILTMKNIPSRISQVASFVWGWTLGAALGAASYTLHTYCPSLKTPLLVSAVSGGIAFTVHLLNDEVRGKIALVKLFAIPIFTAIAAYQLAHRKTHLTPSMLQVAGWSVLPAIATLAIYEKTNVRQGLDAPSAGLSIGIGSALIGLALIGSGKVAAACSRFFKSHGSVLGTGLIAGLTTAAMVPLSKRSLDYYSPTYLSRIEKQEGKEIVHRAILTGGASALLTALLVQRVSFWIGGSSLSLIQRIGLGALTLPLAGGPLVYAEIKINGLQEAQQRDQIHLETEEEAPTPMQEITPMDGLVAASSGLATLALSVGLVSALILTKDGLSWAWARKSAPLTPFKWTWANHPELKGVVATAASSTVGYGSAKLLGIDKTAASVAAGLFATLGAPSIARHYFSYEMGQGEALTALFAGLLTYSPSTQKSRRSFKDDYN